jgi:hypothetical protein
MKRTFYLFGLALFTIVLSRVLGRESAIVEKYYYGGLYQVFRSIYDYTFGFLPIPMMYVFVLIILFFLYKIIRSFLNTNKRGIGRLKSPFLLLINVLSVLVLCFYWFWGFNYNRQSIESTIGLDYSKMDTTDLMQQYESSVAALVELHSTFDKQTEVQSILNDPSRFETSCRKSLTNQLDQLSYHTNGRVRIRRLQPQGALLRISTAGVYWPFVFEGHIDPGLHPMTWPFTMSHEMGHGYGFTDEGTCNFLGWLGCVNNDDPFIQYSGWIGYLRYVLSNLRGALDDDAYRALYGNLPLFVKTDLSEIREYAMRYPDVFPAIRDVFYHNYLKTHGVKGGLINYSKVVKLVHAWEVKQGKK